MAEPQAQARGGVVVVALVAGCYAAAGAQATRSLSSGDPWDWGETLFRWILYAVMGTVIGALTRLGPVGASDKRAERAALRTALRTGELPDGVGPDAWRALLAAEDREYRRARWAVLVLFQLIAVLVAAAAVVVNDSAPGVWALALTLAVLVVVPLGWLAGRRRRVRTLLAHLDTA